MQYASHTTCLNSSCSPRTTQYTMKCFRCGKPASRIMGVVTSLLEGKVDEIPLCEHCFYHYNVYKKKNRLLFRDKRAITIRMGILILIESVKLARFLERLAHTVLGSIASSRVLEVAGPATVMLALLLLIRPLISYLLNPALLTEVRRVLAESPSYGLTFILGIGPPVPFIQGWIAIVIALSVHEAAHALAAARLGFGEPRAVGLMLAGPFLLGAYVDVNAISLKKPGHHARMAAAGIFSNILVASLCYLVLTILLLSSSSHIDLRLFMVPPEIIRFLGGSITADFWTSLLSWIGFLNLWIGIFNALPIPILDGYYILAGTFSSKLGAKSFKLTKVVGFITISLLVIRILILYLP